MFGIVIRYISCVAAIWLTTVIYPLCASFDSYGALAAAAAVLFLVNSTLRPILKLLTFPIGCFTLGLSGLLIDTLMVWLISQYLPGIRIEGFFVMLTCALLCSLANSAMNYRNKPQ
ncbi:MAG: phage holin family protein [Clostridia bacterium]|nr:phage holin family protein [Clostridia bacterium]